MSETPKSAQPGGPRNDSTGRGEVENAKAGRGRAPGERVEPTLGGAGQAQPQRAQTEQDRPERDEPEQREPERPEEDVNADEKSMQEQLEAVQTELAQHKDRYLRAAAEAENIRRRADNDIANARKYAIEGFASEILVVRDSLEIARALDIAADDAGAVAKMKEGLDLTLKQLDNALAKYSIEAIEPQKGDKLDPDRHQAMTTQESDNVPPNHILSIIQKGYMIHDRLLRPAMVVVARKPQEQARAEDETA